MRDLGSNIGPSSIRRRIAAVIAVIGIVLVGGQLARRWPRTVEIAYSIDPGVIELDVDYLQEDEAVASARFNQQEAKTALIRHSVRLQPGEYQARMTVYGSDGRAVEHRQVLVVPAAGLTRFDLKEATTRSQ